MIQTLSHDLRVDIISDVVCPWCIIGYRQLKQAADASSKTLDVHWHPFELNPQMSSEGQDLREHVAEKYGSTAEDSAKTRDKIVQIGEELDFKFSFTSESRIVNTFLAHQLIHWAEIKGQGHEAKMALFRHYFTEGRDVSRKEVLLEAVGELGLDVEETGTVLNKGNLANTVREAEQFWTSRGIQGVPAMIFDQRHLVTGAQGVENYTQIIRQLTETEAA